MQSPNTSKRIVLTQHMFGLGGIDRVGCLLVNGFAEAGFETDLLVFCRGGPAEETLLSLLNNRVRVTFLGGRSQSRTNDLIRLSPKWIQWLRENNPDMVMSTCNNMNWISAIGVKLSGLASAKLILKTTNPVVRAKDRGIAGGIRKFCYRKAFEFADKVLALSDAETNLLQQQFPSAAAHIETVINPYVTGEMLAAVRVKEIPAGQRTILGVGRFESQKRMDLLIRSFANLDEPSTRLVILGDGPEKQECEKLVCELGIETRVLMPGFVADADAWLNAADMFVLTSAYEGLPAVVLEAMACNCPVLSTDCFLAARELLSGAEGCAIIEEQTPGAIARLMRATLNLEKPKSLHLVARKYSVENGVNSHVEHARALL